MTPETALALWRRALTEEIGIVLTVEVQHKRAIEQVLYEARKSAADPALDVLMIAKPGDAPEELWIVRKTTDMSDFT